MIAGLKPQFHRYVLDGTKRHTIRAWKRKPRVGQIIHLYSERRQKRMRLILAAPITRVEDIIIQRSREGLSVNDPPRKLLVWINGELLDRDEAESFFWRDGFRPVSHYRTPMMLANDFWSEQLNDGFAGYLIHWDYDKREVQP